MNEGPQYPAIYWWAWAAALLTLGFLAVLFLTVDAQAGPGAIRFEISGKSTVGPGGQWVGYGEGILAVGRWAWLNGTVDISGWLRWDGGPYETIGAGGWKSCFVEGKLASGSQWWHFHRDYMDVHVTGSAPIAERLCYA